MADLRRLNTADWGVPVELIDPDGKKYDTDYATGAPLAAVQVLYDSAKADPATGGEMRVAVPVVVLSMASLERVPKDGERWFIRVPAVPGGEAKNHVFSTDRARADGRSLGFIRMYLQEASQS